MGNYTGNPDNFPLAIAEYDDGTPPSAAQFNPALEGLKDSAAYLAARALAGPLVSLQPAVSAGGPFTGVAPYAFCWNDRPYAFSSEVSAQSWLVCGYNVGITVFWNMGTDSVWTQIGGTIVTGNPADDIEVSPGGHLWVVTHDAAHIAPFKCAPGGAFAAIGPNNVTTCTDAQLAKAPVGSGVAVYIAAGSSTAGDALLGNGTDAGGDNFAGGFTATKWLLDSNGVYGLAIPKQAAVNQNAFKSNAAGTLWTGTAIGIGNTDVPIALAWNAVRGLWLLAVSVAGGIPTAFYTSPDGVIWTHASTLNNVNTGGAAAACGPFFFFLDNDGNATPHMRLLISIDGGVTWFAEPIRLIGTAADNVPRIVAAPHMLAMAPAVSPTAGAPASASIRFSNVCGKGDQAST